jgi:hypothetical protein
MTTSLTDTAQDPIDNLDLEPIIIKLTAAVDSGGFAWPEDSAWEVATEYRDFLKSARVAIQAKPDGKTTAPIRPPNRVVDIFWHTHILFTPKYFKDCELVFGRYLHHLPILPDNLTDEDVNNASPA